MRNALQLMQASHLGLEPGRVRIVDGDQSWALAFEELRASLIGVVDDVIVEHIGSTSVPGLAAKPLLDVALGFGPATVVDELVEALESLGFVFVEDLGAYGGLFFTASAPDGRVFVHVHAVERSDPQWRRYVAFRDHLRAHPEAAAEYAALKRRLALEHPRDREAYTAGKFDWISNVVLSLD